MKENEAGLTKSHDIAVLTNAGNVEDEGSLDELGEVRHKAGEGLLVSVERTEMRPLPAGLSCARTEQLDMLVELLDLELCVELVGLVNNRSEGGRSSLARRSDVDQSGRGKSRDPGNGASSRDGAHDAVVK